MKEMRILVVDDNSVNLAAVEQELKDKYEVVPMLSGHRAIKYLGKEKVDLILLDIQMPVMDGIETLKEIRTQENGKTVPVIFLTTKNDMLTVVEGAKLGIMDYITKPVDTNELHERIEKVFKRLGLLPMEEEELYQRLKDILLDIENSRVKQAVFKVEEILGYQLQEDISEKIKSAKQNLESENIEDAKNIIILVVQMLEKNMQKADKVDSMPISIGEICTRLRYIIEEFENFRIKNAGTKIKELKEFTLPVYVEEVLEKALVKLDNYDDEAAEKLLKELLTEVKE